jgi:hypothetical protein
MGIGALFTSPDWGTLPDWLAAVGTIWAMLVALRLARRDGKRLESERTEAAADRALFRKQQAAEAEALRRRLAAKVTLVVETYRDGGVKHHGWKVHNGGDEPISMVSVVRRAIAADDSTPNPTPFIAKTWPSIEAGGSRSEVAPIYDEHYMAQGELQFTDGTGQRWQRMEFGALRTIDPDDAHALRFVPIQR